MPQSLSSILVHLIFSTKNRHPFIDPTIEPELHPYLATVFRELDSPSLTLNGMPDHIHALFQLGRTTTIADVVEEVKKRSSKWIKTKGISFRQFSWQRGYAAFSIGQSKVNHLKKYIARQKLHHEKKSFQDEVREFLTKYQMEWDERYVWD